MLKDRLVAHRGFQKLYPENTLLGLSKAIEAGAHFIETDIQFSADYQPVLYHDLPMKRLSGVENLLSNLTLAELSQHSCFEPQRLGDKFRGEAIAMLLDLVALLKANPQVTAFVEIKRTAVQFAGLENTFSILESQLQPVQAQAVLISFDYAVIAYAHSKSYPRLGFVLQQWSDLESDVVASTEVEFLFCDQEKIPADADLGNLSSKLVVYEVDNPDVAASLFARGVDMVETFDIGGMLDGLGRHAL
ncbi:MAG: hypothetical protein VR73_05770 [Gammaproteobacteria bacterium BRH_c0]|nr:MAG: hypothetical protein VR73_05770 [Gammaproteobacteria bacterium BRH_c0]